MEYVCPYDAWIKPINSTSINVAGIQMICVKEIRTLWSIHFIFRKRVQNYEHTLKDVDEIKFLMTLFQHHGTQLSF